MLDSKNRRKRKNARKHSLLVRVKRWGRYMYLRVLRFNDPPERIAVGAAIGVAAGLLPTFGFGILLAIFFSYILKVNKGAAILGSFVMNPVTTPLVWTLSSVVGALIFWEDKNIILEVVRNYNLHDGVKWAAVVFLVGNVIISTIFSIIVYFVVKRWVTQYRMKKAARRAAGMDNSPTS